MAYVYDMLYRDLCRNSRLAETMLFLNLRAYRVSNSGPRGWGSEEATQLLLNNLMHITVSLASDHERELAELWRALALSFPANLPVILNYIYVITVLSHEALLSYVGYFI